MMCPSPATGTAPSSNPVGLADDTVGLIKLTAKLIQLRGHMIQGTKAKLGAMAEQGLLGCKAEYLGRPFALPLRSYEPSPLAT